jgi:hypothetical protein
MSIYIGSLQSPSVSIKNRSIGLGAPAANTSLFIQPTSETIVDLSPNSHSLISNCTFIPNQNWPGKYIFQASGSNKYIQGPTNNQTFNLGTGSFTLEAILQPIDNNVGDYGRIMGTEDSGLSGWSFELPPGNGFPNALRLERLVNDSVIQPSFTFVKNNVYHVAITRNGNIFRVFVNGTQIDMKTISVTFPSYAKLRCLSRSDSYVRAIRANFYAIRIVKGVSLYNGNFTANISQPMYLY